MDFYTAIEDLYAEKQKLEHVIASIEDLQRAAGGPMPPMAKRARRRGRKPMGPAERNDVSARMTNYWTGRRAAKASHQV
jgi:hypothetical protein